MGPPISKETILGTLRELNEHISVPLWLFGGVAVDFLVGKWTRPHSDVDLNTFWDTGDLLADQLERIGYRTSDQGWITHWSQATTGRILEIVFLERCDEGAAELVIAPDAPVGIPGRYQLPRGYMQMNRFATLDGVTFRTCSPAGEWLARAKSVVAGRTPEPKIEHDRALLEQLIPPHELADLRRYIETLSH